jgi:hypothetical protein
LTVTAAPGASGDGKPTPTPPTGSNRRGRTTWQEPVADLLLTVDRAAVLLGTGTRFIRGIIVERRLAYVKRIRHRLLSILGRLVRHARRDRLHLPKTHPCMALLLQGLERLHSFAPTCPGHHRRPTSEDHRRHEPAPRRHRVNCHTPLPQPTRRPAAEPRQDHKARSQRIQANDEFGDLLLDSRAEHVDVGGGVGPPARPAGELERAARCLGQPPASSTAAARSPS